MTIKNWEQFNSKVANLIKDYDGSTEDAYQALLNISKQAYFMGFSDAIFNDMQNQDNDFSAINQKKQEMGDYMADLISDRAQISWDILVEDDGALYQLLKDLSRQPLELKLIHQMIQTGYYIGYSICLINLKEVVLEIKKEQGEVKQSQSSFSEEQIQQVSQSATQAFLQHLQRTPYLIQKLYLVIKGQLDKSTI